MNSGVSNARGIDVCGVSKTFESGAGAVHVLQDVSFSVPAGSLFTLLGASGSGKTTLLNLMGGLELPTSGHVDVFGTRVSALTTEARAKFRREQLGFVFQFYNLLPTLTAAENVKVGLELLGLSRGEVDARAAEALEAVELGGKQQRLPAQLSGGEQQRVAIARALAKRPLLVLADEPTGNLDRATGQAILGMMRALKDSHGTTFVIVTHDPEVGQLSDASFRVDRLSASSERRLKEVS